MISPFVRLLWAQKYNRSRWGSNPEPNTPETAVLPIEKTDLLSLCCHHTIGASADLKVINMIYLCINPALIPA